jgi:hypothetical protein
MRRSICGLSLALAACGSTPRHDPAPQASETSAGIAAAASPAAQREAAIASSDAEALLSGLVTPRQKGTYPPADECARLPGAEDFRAALARAVLAKDADAVAALALPTVRLGFGGDDGRERFRQRLANPDGKLMADLRELLKLGCAADAQGGLTMPWYFAQDMGDADSYAAMLVTGVDIPLLPVADAKSAAQDRLSWELVTLDGGLQPDKAFQRVTTAGGHKGYIATDRLRSLLALRVLAVRKDGEWRISAVVAGD